MQRKLFLSSFDTAQLCQELRSHILTTRINQFSSAGKDLFLLKCATSQKAIESNELNQAQITEFAKFKLVIQPGVRLNLTKFEQNVGQNTNFVQVVRQKLTNLVILAVQQLNFDRVIIIGAGKEEVEYYLIIELYGKGNCILTDDKYTVIQAQNQFKNSRVGSCYMQAAEATSLKQIKEQLTMDYFKQMLTQSFNAKGQQQQLRYVIAKEFYVGGAAASVIIRYSGLAAGVKTKNLSEKDIDTVYNYVYKMLSSLIENNQKSFTEQEPGYIFYYKEEEVNVDAELTDTHVRRALHLAELYPINLNSIFSDLYPTSCVDSFSTFNETVDQYFTMLETCSQYQSQCQILLKQENKQQQIVDENQQRVDNLVKEAEQLKFKARLVQYYSDFVQKFIDILSKQFENSNVSWGSIASQMSVQADPIFQFIDSVDLVQREFHLRLVYKKEMFRDLGYETLDQINQLFKTAEEFESEEISEISDYDSTMIVPVPFTLTDTPGKIFSRFYTKAAALYQKAGKTTMQSNFALTNFKPTQISSTPLKILQKQQNLAWYEKFHWFVSSDGFLVVGGRDASQNEILVKRFAGENDIFVHAEIHGASCVIIKVEPITFGEQTFKKVIPPQQTLTEAALLSIVHSKSWENKTIPKAYWVYRPQVSKQALSGQYVGTGGFVVRGKKNYVQCTNMKFGVGVVWRYSTQQSFCAARFNQVENLELYKQQFENQTETTDFGTEEENVQTKKVKVFQKTAIDVQKQNLKEEQKKEKKRRHLIIKQQKENAKMKRLTKEGRTDIIEKIQQSKEVVELQSCKYCVLCQKNDHNINECEDIFEHEDLLKIRLPPILHQFIKKLQIQEESSEEQSEEQNENDQNENEEDKTEEKVADNLSKPIHYLNTALDVTLEPQATIMLGPISCFKNIDVQFTIVQGNIQRGQSYSQLQAAFAKKFKEQPFALQQLKLVPEHTVLMNIPGSWQIEK
ncbi:Fibronectin-binding_protein A N-terminus (FbpA) domain-containing protein [Hexamita inflata]|uniref:Fibronectin-binding protein A N-terminus (FbpA) domain-containing protein n=1 Tax=Hexamita inflata TaxID=28002 RepID=A0AA86UI24_9EUKA|nr:Fibronectin-binding protein A N-terminus (FbpA) domain-containing protein [Hexamita inflata]